MPSGNPSADRGVDSRGIETVVVAAVDEERAIGRDGDLPWDLPADLRRFKRITMGHPMVMGRRTHESIGTALPGRESIVLTTRNDYEAPGCTVVDGLDAAYDRARECGADRVMVIGGQRVFAEVLAIADRLALTVVSGTHGGDVFFPDFDGDQWEVVDHEFHPRDADNDEAMIFVELRPRVEAPRTVDADSRRGPLPGVLRDLTAVFDEA